MAEIASKTTRKYIPSNPFLEWLDGLCLNLLRRCLRFTLEGLGGDKFGILKATKKEPVAKKKPLRERFREKRAKQMTEKRRMKNV